MTKREALKALAEGKEVRGTDWIQDERIGFDGEDFYFNEGGQPSYTVDFGFLYANDWEIFEPKYLWELPELDVTIKSSTNDPTVIKSIYKTNSVILKGEII